MFGKNLLRTFFLENSLRRLEDAAMECELLNDCNFFQTITGGDQPCIVEKLKDMYCRGNALLCARRRVAHALSRERVPADLHPDHIHQALEIISNGLDTEASD
jgi:hypothetical protein